MRMFALWLIPILGLASCSVQKLAINSLAGALAEGASVYSSDEDPELVREAMPFGLKTLEALIVKAPDNPDLLVGACSGFTQYSYAFVETDAFLVEDESYRKAHALRERARKLYLRARNYCFDALRLVDPDLPEALEREPETAVQRLGAEHEDLIFWTAASWGAAIAQALDQPEFVAEIPAPRALLRRLEALDPAYGDGALAEALLTLAALPSQLGGSEEEARTYFERAQALSKGYSVSSYVTLAKGLAIPQQDREEFVRLLEKALAIDVDAPAARDRRLANLIAQERARAYLERVDEFILDDLDDLPESEPGTH